MGPRGELGRGLADPLDFEGFARGEGDAADVDAEFEEPVAEGGLADAEVVGGHREALFVDHFGEEPFEGALVFLFYPEHEFSLACQCNTSLWDAGVLCNGM